ncbi:transcriptional regulator [Cohnella yongneupensis]|uniref:Transcriptional regulator n=1 Tax=Cohnella yongneupensis TaxID=425006 RepID=A0ABW0QVJ3_9BACL
MLGLGKRRSKFGRFLDKHEIDQEDIRRETGLNKDTVSKACNEDEPALRGITKTALAEAAKKLSNLDVESKDFW